MKSQTRVHRFGFRGRTHSALVALAGAMCLPGVCSGGIVTPALEVEPNNTLLSAQSIPFFPPFFPQQITGSLSPWDVDFYQVQFVSSVIGTAVLQDQEPLKGPHDSVLALFNASGTLLFFNDDAGGSSSILSILDPFVVPAGTYYFAVSGGGDPGFIGTHSQDFSYSLTISYLAVPAPAVLPLLGLAMLARKRRRDDGLDIGILLANWSIPGGSPGCNGAVSCRSDLNCDGVVDGLDIGILLGTWGEGPGASAWPCQSSGMAAAQSAQPELVVTQELLNWISQASYFDLIDWFMHGMPSNPAGHD